MNAPRSAARERRAGSGRARLATHEIRQEMKVAYARRPCISIARWAYNNRGRQPGQTQYNTCEPLRCRVENVLVCMRSSDQRQSERLVDTGEEPQSPLSTTTKPK